jgi:hypothetical protein
MAINRRTLLQGLGLGIALPSLTRANEIEAKKRTFIYGASRLSKTQYAVSKINLQGALQWQTPLPARGHDVAVHPSKPLLVSVARRPGQFLILIEAGSGKQLQLLTVENNLKLNGHAVWFGDFLLVSASDRDRSTMVLLKFELKENALTLVSESHYDYIGPHEMVIRGNDLVIAVGGLKTAGRDVLNRNEFNSAVVIVDIQTMQVTQSYPAPTDHVSLRHLCIDAEGTVFVAGRYQLESERSECLLFKLTDSGYEPFKREATYWTRLKGYIGSIEVMNGEVIATSPRAHWLGKFDSKTLTLNSQMLSHDICALAHDDNDVLVAGCGTGKLWLNKVAINTHVIWDNHFSLSTV